MERQVTPPKQVTSPTWGPPVPCKQALRHDFVFAYCKCEFHFVFKKLSPYSAVNVFRLFPLIDNNQIVVFKKTELFIT